MSLNNIMFKNEHETSFNHFFLFAFNIFHNSCNDNLFFFRTSFSFWASYENKISFDNCKFYFFQNCVFELRTKTRFFSTIVNFIFFKIALLNFVRRREFFRSIIVNYIFFKTVLLNFVRRRDFLSTIVSS